MQYQKWLNEWFENYARPTLKDRTYERYLAMAEDHIIPHVGEAELEKMTPSLLQHFITALLKSGNLKTGEGLAPNSVNIVISVLKNSLREACNLGLTAEPLGDKIKRPRTNEKKVECFSTSEQKMIEAAVKKEEKDKLFGVILCLYTGLRIGELLALEWDDMDLLSGELRVSRSCHDSKDHMGKYCRKTDLPKTSASYRTVPLPHQLLPLLHTLKKRSDTVYVVSEGGEPVSVRSYQRSFELLLQKYRLPHHGFHALRHTFATRALECGMDVRTLSEILGHRNPTVTLRRYAHSFDEHKREMMNRVGDLLTPQGGGESRMLLSLDHYKKKGQENPADFCPFDAFDGIGRNYE